jgi:hypothetical protein
MWQAKNRGVGAPRRGEKKEGPKEGHASRINKRQKPLALTNGHGRHHTTIAPERTLVLIHK